MELQLLCKAFESKEAALEFMAAKNFAGYVLQREVGFTAVCPTYLEGYYTDAKVIAELHNSTWELQAAKRSQSTSSCCKLDSIFS